MELLSILAIAACCVAATVGLLSLIVMSVEAIVIPAKAGTD